MATTILRFWGTHMPTIYVAFSPAMQEWGAEVGISKFLYRVGLTDDEPKAAVDEMNAEGYAGQKDWVLAGSKPVEAMDQAGLLARLSERQKVVDPLYYPKVKGAKDIVRINQRKVEANVVIKLTMEGRESKVPKLKPVDYADYIIGSLI
jgi:hypothetical protein